MLQTRFTVFAVLLTILGGLMLTGCHNDQSLASATTKQFMEAMKSGDLDAMKATLTKAAQVKWSPMMGSMTSQYKIKEYTLGEAVITGETAAVPVTVKDSKDQSSNNKVNLRKEDGQWRVCSIAISTQGISMTVDFEHPENFANDMQKAMGPALEALKKRMNGGK